MRVKVANVYDLQKIQELVQAGADCFAFDFSQPEIDQELTRELILKLPPLILKSGLFTNAPKYEIEELTTFCQLDLIEFHGACLNDQCGGFSQPVIKHLRWAEEIEKWSQLKVAMLQLPLKLYKELRLKVQPLVVEVKTEADFEEILDLKPYAINIDFNDFKNTDQLIRRAKATF